ncbi:formin-2-like [Onychomys torridus]|uniref:formin-2-like n=1 Tax=Onychomys torridus TaxID=38674 RepID=UPI00167F647E|nr:formin-2-like [Onychomys torridus]
MKDGWLRTECGARRWPRPADGCVWARTNARAQGLVLLLVASPGSSRLAQPRGALVPAHRLRRLGRRSVPRLAAGAQTGERSPPPPTASAHHPPPPPLGATFPGAGELPSSSEPASPLAGRRGPLRSWPRPGCPERLEDQPPPAGLRVALERGWLGGRGAGCIPATLATRAAVRAAPLGPPRGQDAVPAGAPSGCGIWAPEDNRVRAPAEAEPSRGDAACPPRARRRRRVPNQSLQGWGATNFCRLPRPSPPGSRRGARLRWREPRPPRPGSGLALLSWPSRWGADLLKNKHVGRGRGPGEALASAGASISRWDLRGENRNQSSPASGPGKPLEPAAPPVLPGHRGLPPFPQDPQDSASSGC